MSDDAVMWAEYREARQQKRADNRVRSTKILVEEGIEFESKNDGAHLIVTSDGDTYDFWPGTGKWKRRGTRLFLRGIKGLLKEIRNRKL